MPSDFVIRPTAPIAPEQPAAAAAPTGRDQPAAPAGRDQPAAPAAHGVALAAEAAGAADALPNPTMRLDPALGLVVIEFHNQTGGVTASIPGPRQLDAYRAARDVRNGPDIGPENAAGSSTGIHPPSTRTV